MMTLNEAAEFLQAQDNFCILTHRRPDGDTVGCAAALCRGLRKLGKRAEIFENAQFTPKFQPYLQGLTSPTIAENAVVVAVDLAAVGLMPLNLPHSCPRIALCIDHHGSNEHYAERLYVRPTAAACGEVIRELLEILQVEPDADIANALYVAISTDTGCFRFANTTEDTFACAAWCKRHGANTFAINQTMFMCRKYERIVLESRLAQGLERFYDGKVCICCLPQSLLDELGLQEDDVDDISSFPRDIEGVELGAVIRDVENGAGKISLRAVPGVDASAICKQLGGGGHAGAAGATVQGGIAAARTALLNAIRDYGYGADA